MLLLMYFLFKQTNNATQRNTKTYNKRMTTTIEINMTLAFEKQIEKMVNTAVKDTISQLSKIYCFDIKKTSSSVSQKKRGRPAKLDIPLIISHPVILEPVIPEVKAKGKEPVIPKEKAKAKAKEPVIPKAKEP